MRKPIREKKIRDDRANAIIFAEAFIKDNPLHCTMGEAFKIIQNLLEVLKNPIDEPPKGQKRLKEIKSMLGTLAQDVEDAQEVVESCLKEMEE